jgi:hypothetical protein
LLEKFVVLFYAKIAKREAKNIVNTILQNWKTAGMHIPAGTTPLVNVVDPTVEVDIRRSLLKMYETLEKPYKMIVCILESYEQRTYEVIKRTTLLELSTLSQVMLLEDVKNAMKFQDKYITDMALKVSLVLTYHRQTINLVALQMRL